MTRSRCSRAGCGPFFPRMYQDSYEDVQPVSMGSAGLKYGARRHRWRGTRSGERSATWRWPAARRTRARCSNRAPRRHRRAARPLRGGRRKRSAAASRWRPISTARPVARARLGARDLSQRRRWPAGCCARSSWRTSPRSARGRRSTFPPRRTFGSRKRSRTSSPSSPRPATTGLGHMPCAQQRAIADLFATMAEESPLVEPALASDDGAEPSARRTVAPAWLRSIARHRAAPAPHRYAGWLGVECPTCARPSG